MRALRQRWVTSGNEATRPVILIVVGHQASLQAALEPLLARDAVLRSDGRASVPGLRAAAGSAARGGQRVGRQARARQLPHPDGQQPSPTVETVLGAIPGVATKYLDSYLRWFQQVGLVREASPRSCLVASMTPQCIRFAN